MSVSMIRIDCSEDGSVQMSIVGEGRAREVAESIMEGVIEEQGDNFEYSYEVESH